jgi:hypothetical protein
VESGSRAHVTAIVKKKSWQEYFDAPAPDRATEIDDIFKRLKGGE